MHLHDLKSQWNILYVCEIWKYSVQEVSSFYKQCLGLAVRGDEQQAYIHVQGY
jgi:hypothetical protein